MNYLKKFEELKWPKIFKESMDSKFNKAISQISIDNIKLKSVKETNERYKTYKSDVNIEVPIKGYQNSTLYVIKDSYRVTEIKVVLSLLFDSSSDVFKINSNRLPSVFSRLVDKDILIKNSADRNNYCYLSFEKYIKTIDDNIETKELYEKIYSTIKEVLNKNWNKINSDINDIVKFIEKELIRIGKEREESDKKKKSLVDNIDIISDALIDLEDMSISHSKTGENGVLIYVYNIPGIKVESTEFSKSAYSRYDTIRFTSDTNKFVLTDELIDVMSAIKSFKKKIQEEIKGSEIKVYFKNSEVSIIISIN